MCANPSKGNPFAACRLLTHFRTFSRFRGAFSPRGAFDDIVVDPVPVCLKSQENFGKRDFQLDGSVTALFSRRAPPSRSRRADSSSLFHRVRISTKSLSMEDALEYKFEALDQCSSVTCKTTDTIHGVAASNVSENPDGRLTTSSQLADESWAPVAQGHLGARVRSISAPSSSAYSWLRIPVLPVVLDRSPPESVLVNVWFGILRPFQVHE